VIFSENDAGISDPIMDALDKDSQMHRLYSSAAECTGTAVIKRLDHLNRDEARIILIDDNPESFQKFPRNTLEVKPFLDVNDKTDTVLLDLIPLLYGLVHDEVTDFRDTFDDLGFLFISIVSFWGILSSPSLFVCLFFLHLKFLIFQALMMPKRPRWSIG
jgi:hypothetical protein